MTTEDTKHTPLPMRTVGDAGIEDADGDVIACLYNKNGENTCPHPTQQKRRAFIVTACNAHADLLAACEGALPWISPGDPIANQVKAAIAKAKGG